MQIISGDSMYEGCFYRSLHIDTSELFLEACIQTKFPAQKLISIKISNYVWRNSCLETFLQHKPVLETFLGKLILCIEFSVYERSLYPLRNSLFEACMYRRTACSEELLPRSCLFSRVSFLRFVFVKEFFTISHYTKEFIIRFLYT